MSSDGDWSDYRLHVLKELERQNDNVEALNARLDVFEKTCLQKEGDQKVVNAETRMKIYFMDVILGAAGALIIVALQWLLTHF